MKRGKYIVVAPVLCPHIITLKKRLQDSVRSIVGERVIRFPVWEYGFNHGDDNPKDHITLAAPLFSSYERASELSMALDMCCMRLHDEGLGLRASLSVKGLKWFRNESEDILVLEIASKVLDEVANRVRNLVNAEEEMVWCNPLPDNGEVNLHITICAGKDIFSQLDHWVLEQQIDSSMFDGRVLFPTLLARYVPGWRWLSCDPAAQ
ncbi:MAG: hypothetical protein RIQ41_466 [Candidatus Parcubacteria bacterium]|jgi:hypothetical protein